LIDSKKFLYSDSILEILLGPKQFLEDLKKLSSSDLVVNQVLKGKCRKVAGNDFLD